MLDPFDPDQEAGQRVKDSVINKGLARPSQEEVDAHYASGHCPFRSWCVHCVKGQSQANPHFATCHPCGTLDSSDVPTVSADYMFMTSASDEPRDAALEGEPGESTILVSLDHWTGVGFSRVVGKKGVDTYSTIRLGGDLRTLG